jgi:hypothetical protein
LLSERLPLNTLARLLGWSVALFVFIVLLSAWFPMLVHSFEGEDLPGRVLVALIAIVPSGVLMGFGFPTAMRLVNAIDTRPTPWFWAVNGSAGVLAVTSSEGGPNSDVSSVLTADGLEVLIV